MGKMKFIINQPRVGQGVITDVRAPGSEVPYVPKTIFMKEVKEVYETVTNEADEGAEKPYVPKTLEEVINEMSKNKTEMKRSAVNSMQGEAPYITPRLFSKMEDRV